MAKVNNNNSAIVREGNRGELFDSPSSEVCRRVQSSAADGGLLGVRLGLDSKVSDAALLPFVCRLSAVLLPFFRRHCQYRPARLQPLQHLNPIANSGDETVEGGRQAQGKGVTCADRRTSRLPLELSMAKCPSSAKKRRINCPFSNRLMSADVSIRPWC